ncbi:hypothetical protein APASM_6690 [Actinosynnema pretiosum subsp. pretiosum]|nr:hypothetical protein APASM_6690 [Actinosynnema pretiosum subsp. pretiosum]
MRGEELKGTPRRRGRAQGHASPAGQTSKKEGTRALPAGDCWGGGAVYPCGGRGPSSPCGLLSGKHTCQDAVGLGRSAGRCGGILTSALGLRQATRRRGTREWAAAGSLRSPCSPRGGQRAKRSAGEAVSGRSGQRAKRSACEAVSVRAGA